MRRRLVPAAVAAALALVCVPATEPSEASGTQILPVPSPVVKGPIASDPVGSQSRDYPFGAALQDLRRAGYVEQEFFFTGTAAGQKYTSRMLVRRPSSAKKFSGTVVTEWTNVSNNFDVECLWGRSANQILRDGDAYVSVDAQTVGVNDSKTGLKAFSPKRYRDLTIPTTGTFVAELGSYDIFAQALKAVRAPSGVRPLGPLTVKRQIATGCSQSAATLSIYAASMGGLQGLADAYLITMLSTSSIDLSPAGVVFPVPTPQLLGVPVLQLNTETDEGHLLKAPDGPTYRLWEVAGSSHEDAQLHSSSARIFRRDFGRSLPKEKCDLPPYSQVPFSHVQNAALVAVKRWIRDGTAPPSFPQITYTADGGISRDRHGNALGGIRLPAMTVPTSTDSSLNSGSTLCSQLLGSHVPFSESTLRKMYPSHAAYVRAVTRSAASAVRSGYLLAHDAKSTIAEAQGSSVP